VEVNIINFKNEYEKHFYDLNIEWLNNFFEVEEYDHKILSNAKKYIIDKLSISENEFEIIMRKIGYNKEHNKGWMPFWHLSGDDIWSLYSINHQIVKRTAFKQFKPKTKKQLLSKVNYALINLDKINYFSSTNKRAATRKQIFNLLKKDQELIGNKILEYYNV